MARTPVLAALLLALACAAARAQPQPPPKPLDLDQLAALIQSEPTDAKNIPLHFRAFTIALERRGVPPTLEQRVRLRRIHRMLQDGRLTPASEALDRLIADIHSGRPGPSAAQWREAERATAPRAAPSEALMSDTPRLLSQPPSEPLRQAPPPAAPANIAIAPAGTPFKAAPAASAIPPVPPGPGNLPVPLFVLGGAALLGGSWLALRRFAGGPKLPVIKIRQAPARAPAGRLEDKYMIGRSIAAGGMGEIFEGTDLKLGRRVAIKRMLADVQADASLRAQFLKEARMVAKLSHPYIVQIHDCVESGDDVYIVFEYVDGETLAARLQREARLPLKECRRILGYVGEAIEYAHKNHVLHRDIKPANIMLDKSGIARVMDFGISQESTRIHSSTTTGPVMDGTGTLRYMPPEQHFGAGVRASDVYAMGVCLYEMATGHTPFSATTAEALIAEKRARRFPPASTLVPGLSKDFDVLIAAALEPDPGNRVGSPHELLQMLDDVLAGAPRA